jgi:homoserine/homoserine lactone efflux protein
MTVEAWLLFVLVCLVPAFTPGPAIVLAIANTLRYGAIAAFWSSLGNALGMVLVGVAVTLGLDAVLSVSATAFLILKVFAIGYLVWLGLRIFMDRSAIEISAAPVIPKEKLFWQAFVVSVTNPKAVLLFGALLPMFIETEAPLLAQGSLLSVTLAVVTIVSHRCYAVAFEHAQKYLRDSIRIRWARRVLGGSLVGLAFGLLGANR